uniref:Uncharacterized protein n=1 Tax=Anser brachyrhynchus TaxID=132585 RepID=A0A8B9BK01_9AVES
CCMWPAGTSSPPSLFPPVKLMRSRRPVLGNGTWQLSGALLSRNLHCSPFVRGQGRIVRGQREACSFSCLWEYFFGKADNDTITRNLYLHTKILIALVFFILKFA